MAAETKNGGISLNNNNSCKDHSRRKLLVGVDLFCLFLGKIPSRCRESASTQRIPGSNPGPGSN